MHLHKEITKEKKRADSHQKKEVWHELKTKLGISSMQPKESKKKQHDLRNSVQVIYTKKSKNTNKIDNSIRRTITNLPFGERHSDIKDTYLEDKEPNEHDRRKTMKENFVNLVKSVPDLKFSHEIPIYKEAFPNLYDQEIKSLCLSKASFDKIQQIRSAREQRIQSARSRATSKEGIVDIVSSNQKDDKKKGYRTIEEYYNDCKHRIDPIIAKRDKYNSLIQIVEK